MYVTRSWVEWPTGERGRGFYARVRSAYSVPMPFIKTVPPGRATGRTAEVYGWGYRTAGYPKMPNIVQVFSLRAGSMRRMIRTWELAMVVGREPRMMRELAAVTVSRFNACHY